MAVLVTRPYPDNETTAVALRAKGFEVLLAPMLRFEPLAFMDDGNVPYEGVIATSANALRAIDAHPASTRLLDLPLFAVGEHTAAAARKIGFRDIVAGNSGASALPDLVDARLGSVQFGRAAEQIPLLYLAGIDIAHDPSGELGERGFSVATHATYRMVPITRLPDDVREAFADDRVEAILHYSQRSARAFVTAARADGFEISALALPQCCISDAVAMALRDAGAAHVVVAHSADEKSMLEAVERTLRS